MTASGAELKDLGIKAGVVQRTAKELSSYRAEHKQQTTKVEKLRGESELDGAVLRQWENVASETRAMIPDTTSRLQDAVI
eukprot:CAMPEP_0185845598 /NCGR_PEP_ID=MMETSP1354-20130828/1519_1 /TAXON_ID=708628 /ORGANISM="Erythrolobus madagascarensis, Strain CCMP3276" /LENGTH=79 /DNA_ID=CAMNT_0028545591 /DNA_START=17 /DNA_END=253 /DNA_ORIENTATION=-